jgi:hypothetical protein
MNKRSPWFFIEKIVIKTVNEPFNGLDNQYSMPNKFEALKNSVKTFISYLQMLLKFKTWSNFGILR